MPVEPQAWPSSSGESGHSRPRTVFHTYYQHIVTYFSGSHVVAIPRKEMRKRW
jgi:hypothetical protein